MANGDKIIITFFECQISKYKIPWIENPDDQLPQNMNISKAKDQLLRDNLRFSELFQDIEFLDKIIFNNCIVNPRMEQKENTKIYNILCKDDLKAALHLLF